MKLINVHWYSSQALAILLIKRQLFREKNGTVKINNAKELKSQLVRRSVWALADNLQAVRGFNQ